MNVFVTGTSGGLDYGLVQHYLAGGDEVYGLSRSRPENADNYHFASCDIADFETLPEHLERLLEVDTLELVVLNAGTLGRIQDMSRCTMEELKMQMDTNLLANLAPGLIETPMLGSILYGDHDTERYTAVERLRQSKEEGLVMTPAECAARIDASRRQLMTYQSGEYIDIRHLSN